MSKVTILSGILLDESTCYTLDELCRLCHVRIELVREMVDEGLVRPQGAEPTQWRFAGDELRRMQAALRLQRDLGVNLPGAALALDLLDEIVELRRRLGQ
ncbi:MAG: MerR family transcriptional regulator [Desulfobulbaceae bacterium A2]|nr:MAG: MerR family transcriptional regulator [Desulfobulbaceae bacterium A2]